MTKTLEEIANAIGTEDIAYAIQNGYVSPEDFEDHDLQVACVWVADGLREIETALEDYLP
jgi:hypothetical protein